MIQGPLKTTKTVNDLKRFPKIAKDPSDIRLATVYQKLQTCPNVLKDFSIPLFQVWSLESWVSQNSKYIEALFNDNLVHFFRADTFLLISIFLFVAAVLASILKQCDEHSKIE